MRYRIACTIAGSDSGGGAGVQADLKTFSALGVFGTSVITAITAQNTLGVTGIEAVVPDILSKQLSVVFDDLQPDAVKIGMIHNVEAARVVAKHIEERRSAHVAECMTNCIRQDAHTRNDERFLASLEMTTCVLGEGGGSGGGVAAAPATSSYKSLRVIPNGAKRNEESDALREQVAKQCNLPSIVLDPVMIAESGAKLIEDETIEFIKTKLFRCVSIITPNIPEAETLTGMKITDRATLVASARMLIEQGAPAVLLKGGHLAGDEKHDCLLIRNHEPVILSHPTVATDNTHGTGCTLSSAIAAYLALGEELTTAVKKATDYLQQALQAGADIQIGHGNGPVNHFFNPQPLKIFEP